MRSSTWHTFRNHFAATTIVVAFFRTSRIYLRFLACKGFVSDFLTVVALRWARLALIRTNVLVGALLRACLCDI